MVRVDNEITSTGGGNVFFIIVAAGSGSRFGSEVPKQFLLLDGTPVVVRTVEALYSAVPEAHFYLVLSPDGTEYWDKMKAACRVPDVTVVYGGASRSESVSNAIAALSAAHSLSADDVIMVHDAARPLVAPEMVRALLAAFADKNVDAVVPVLPLTEALAEVCGDDCVTPVPRSGFRTVQTPQAFRAPLIGRAYADAKGDVLADDAAIAVKYADAKLHTVKGHPHNIKITNPADIALAQVLLARHIPY